MSLFLQFLLALIIQGQPTDSQPTFNFNNTTDSMVWKKIDSLENRGFIDQASAMLDDYISKVQIQSQPYEWVRTRIYKARYLDLKSDQPELKGIYYLEAELKKTEGPVRDILQSLMGEFYFNYANNHYYSIQNQASGQGTASDSIEYWSMAELIQRSNNLYLASIESSRNYKSLHLKDATTLVAYDSTQMPLFDNLYELLVYRALSHYFDDRSRLTEPIYTFRVDQPEFLLNYKEFEKFNFSTEDSSSFLYTALKIFQREIPNLLSNPELLMALDTRRLKAVLAASPLENKEDLYIQAQRQNAVIWKAHPVFSEITFHIASALIDKSNRYQPLDSTTFQFRWLKKEALELIQESKSKFPDSKGSKLCTQLEQSILQTELNIEMESFILPGTHQPVLIRYRNRSEATFYIHKITFKEYLDIRKLNNEKRAAYFKTKKEWRTQKYSLPKQEDYQMHSVEMVMEPFEPGLYVIIPDTVDTVSNKHYMPYTFVNASEINMVTRQESSYQTGVWVTDRNNSCPIPGAKVIVKVHEGYSGNEQKFKTSEYTTDKNGYVKFKTDSNRGIEIMVQYKEHLILPNHLYHYEYTPESYESVVFFTDRAIYRPGQTVYYKGIKLRYDSKSVPSIVGNSKVSIQFLDANYQKISNADQRTNEFGSFNGSFVIPTGTLNGIFYINTLNGSGSTQIRVEEYKRPKFFVEFEDVVETYKIGQEVQMTGFAKMYAGVPVMDGHVKYRVTRTVYYPWLPWYRMPPMSGQEAEIAQGVVVTDAEGKFKFSFTATEPVGNDHRHKPVYNYKIYAEVTDGAGETRIGSKDIPISTISTLPIIHKPSSVFSDQVKKLEFDIQNMSGVTQNADAIVRLHLLQKPEKYLIPRKWNRPDIQIYDEKQYKKWFPDRVYMEEDKIYNRGIDKTIMNTTVNPSKSKFLNLTSTLSSGMYMIELEMVENGQKLVKQEYFEIFDSKSPVLPPSESPLWLNVAKVSYQPCDTVEVFVGNPYERSCFYISVEKNGTIIRDGWQDIKKMYSFKIPVLDTDRGGIFIHAFYTHKDQVITKTLNIKVPWTNKDLDIEWQTKRDMILPGAEETWDLIIKGKQKEKLAIELLASMYDASLDQITPHQWVYPEFPIHSSQRRFNHFYNTGVTTLSIRDRLYPDTHYSSAFIPYLRHNIFVSRYPQFSYMDKSVSGNMPRSTMRDGEGVPAMGQEESAQSIDLQSSDEVKRKEIPVVEETVVQLRTNLNETVFFYPELYTDKDGNIRFSFKMNDALTKWRFMLFAHDQKLARGYSEFMIETRKDLMVFPNVPRFVRQNDTINMAFKVNNLTEMPIDATVSLQIKDLISGESLNSWFIEGNGSTPLSIASKGSSNWAPAIRIPDDFTGLIELTYMARSGSHSDAEVHLIPVLTNRGLVTESLNLWVNEKEKRTFEFKSYRDNSSSTSLKHHQLTLEFSPNPAWYALQAMPYIMEYPHQGTEQRVSKLYANMLGSNLMLKYPKVKSYFETWNQKGDLQSELHKNEELKSALLAETPWVIQAQNETEQRKRLQLLFDLNQMGQEYERIIQQLTTSQSSGGGFPWFPGGRDNWYVTQYVVEKFGHLDKLGVKDVREDPRLRSILQQALAYCDRETVEYYKKIQKSLDQNKSKWDFGHVNSLIIHYLYARTFFQDMPKTEEVRKVYQHFLDLAATHYIKFSLHDQGMLAIVLYRNLRNKEAQQLMKSLLERSVYNDEMGRFWKLTPSWFWYSQPIETHTVLLEAIHEIDPNSKAVSEMKRWLLKQKQTTHWPTTVSTSKAIYILLSNNDQWVESKPDLKINLSGKQIDIPIEQQSLGSGYFSMKVDTNQFKHSNPTIELVNNAGTPGWGGIYWQYFEDLDKIKTFKETPLRIDKKLFKKTNSPSGPVLKAIDDQSTVQVGDILTVRIHLRVDRAMEYVHMKDLRAAGLEPVDALSSYKWQGGLGYYQSIRDQAIDFFFEYLSPGTYVFEYDLRVFHKGNYSNGYTQIQSMYAPEFSSHSSGIRIKIK
jgi:uncharacterized protein YfaS (alpha-2-macroglobulin family)